MLRLQLLMINGSLRPYRRQASWWQRVRPARPDRPRRGAQRR